MSTNAFASAVMAGLDPAIHRASVRERQKILFGAQTRAGWMAVSVGGHDE